MGVDISRALGLAVQYASWFDRFAGASEGVR